MIAMLNRCWICGLPLHVYESLDSQGRRFRHGDGQNTIDAHKRLCDDCWEEIERVRIEKVKFQCGRRP